MSTSFLDLNSHSRSLPQCGFAADSDFDSLINTNRFLFRVYTPKESSVSGDSEAYFVAPRFNDQVARSPIDLPNVKFPETIVGTFAEVSRHMDWTTKSSSCYVSTSFSFAWAVWEAVKRYHVGVKKDVEIAIIDASALGGRAATAVQLLMKSSPNQRDENFRKCHRFSHDSQTVLIYGMVPRQAVLASIPLLHILRKLPSYFLNKDIQVIDGNPLDRIAWKYTLRKLSYRQFCRDMSALFLNRPDDVKLRDSTGGAVRLAVAFLRPFFHRVVQDDFDKAIFYLRTLAVSISQWPGEAWVGNYPEVKKIVDSMALALGEELREKYAVLHQEEMSRLRLVINSLEQTLEAQDKRTFAIDDLEVDTDGDFEVEPDEPTLVTLDALTKDSTPPEPRPSLRMSIAILPRIPVSFQTPITPPESPRNSVLFPSATVPLTDLVSTQFPFDSINPETRKPEELPLPLKSSPSSEVPASPPLTPPRRSPVFSRSIENWLTVHAPSAERMGDNLKWNSDQVQDPQDSEYLEKLVEQTLSNDVGHQIQYGIDDWNDDDGDQTDIGDDGPASNLSSPRSSIFSLETLYDNTDIPPKRLSFSHSRSNSFDVFGSLSPPLLTSRTVSFSEPLATTASFPMKHIIDPLTISLPPSPAPSTTSGRDFLPISRSVSPSALSESISSPVPAQHDTSITKKPLIIPPKRRISLLSPFPREDDEEGDTIRSSGVTETASFIVTGFLVGAFITLFLFSTQRRTLLYVT